MCIWIKAVQNPMYVMLACLFSQCTRLVLFAKMQMDSSWDAEACMEAQVDWIDGRDEAIMWRVSTWIGRYTQLDLADPCGRTWYSQSGEETRLAVLLYLSLISKGLWLTLPLWVPVRNMHFLSTCFFLTLSWRDRCVLDATFTWHPNSMFIFLANYSMSSLIKRYLTFLFFTQCRVYLSWVVVLKYEVQSL